MLPLGYITIEALSINVPQDSQLSLRNYNTCILFISSEVTVEEGKIP
jgi:hypothetical protein